MYNFNAEKTKNQCVQWIRDFFEENGDKSLEEAIKCWKYKKSLKGHNRYESSDLEAL